MSWNHRVIKKQNDYDEISYEIHEVYYDSKGNIDGWTSDPVAPCGETVDDLKTDLAYFLNALEKPVLEVQGKTLVEVNGS